MPIATIPATRRTLYYERGGASPSPSTPCLVFLDGTGSDLRDGLGAKRIAALGQRGFDVICFDHRGFGQSADPADTLADGWRMAHFADDAAGLIRELVPCKQAHVVGWSFGGMVAQVTSSLLFPYLALPCSDPSSNFRALIIPPALPNASCSTWRFGTPTWCAAWC